MPEDAVSVAGAVSVNEPVRVSSVDSVANPVIAAGGVMVESCAAVRTTGTEAAANA